LLQTLNLKKPKRTKAMWESIIYYLSHYLQQK